MGYRQVATTFGPLMVDETTGALLVDAGGFVIEADIIDADMYDITGVPPNSMDLYELGTFGLGVGYGPGGGFLWDGYNMQPYLQTLHYDMQYYLSSYYGGINVADAAYSTYQAVEYNLHDGMAGMPYLEVIKQYYLTDPWSTGMELSTLVACLLGYPEGGDYGEEAYTRFDAAGQDAYTAVGAAIPRTCHNLSARCETSDALLSFDGSNDHVRVCAGDPPVVLRGVVVPNATIRAKNATPGSNYANLAINIW